MHEASYPSLKDRHVLITGGSSGIGATLVESFERQGSRVSFLDVLEPGDSDNGFIHCDLTDIEALEHALKAAVRDRGPIDVLINNAASDERHTLLDITPSYYEQRMAVNLRHFIFATRAVVPSMQERKSGVIINMGSTAWHIAVPNIPLYETAKAGIEGLTRSLARDLGPHGIRVVCILPGAVETPKQKQWYSPEEVEELLKVQCLPVRVQPTDVAALTMFLASDDARACSAHNYHVDAGLS